MPKRARGTQQRKIKIRPRQLLGGTQDKQLVQIGMRRQQPAERRLSGQHDPSAPLLQQPGISEEMERIAQALLGQQQQAASRQGFARPTRKAMRRGRNSGMRSRPSYAGQPRS